MTNQRQNFVGPCTQPFFDQFTKHSEYFLKKAYSESLSSLISGPECEFKVNRCNTIRALRLDSQQEEDRSLIKIGWIDFYPHWNPTSNYVTTILDLAGINYEVTDSPGDADLLFCSVYGVDYLTSGLYKSKFGFLLSGENVRPNFLVYDFSMTTDPYAYCGKNVRWPEYFSQLNWSSHDKIDSIEKLDSLVPFYKSWEERDIMFSIIYNNACPHREHFTALLKNKYGSASVQSYGSTRIGRDCNKYEILGRSKFHLAFENSIHPGYVTEKLFQSLLMGTFSLYWGASDVQRDFGDKGFINLADFIYSDELSLFSFIDKFMESSSFRNERTLNSVSMDFLKSHPRQYLNNTLLFLQKVCDAILGLKSFKI